MRAKNSPPAHIVFAGGVTGGHVFPALAVADQLRRRVSIRMTFLGTNRPKERDWVRRARIDHVPVASAPLSISPVSAIAAATRNFRGYLAAGAFLRREKVDVVVGLGGYASAPTVRAAITAGIPVVLLEANAVPGRVTRWLARRARCVCTAFESAAERLPDSADVRLTGLPIRTIPRDACLGVDRQIAVLGGSGGAQTINLEVPKALFRIRDLLRGWRIVHQAGTEYLTSARGIYARLGLEADVEPFFDDLPRVLGESAVAITRAGGSILAEVAAARLPAVLVPFPESAGDHQRHNATAFARRAGCPVVDETGGPRRIDCRIAEALESILTDSRRRETISHLLGRVARVDAADAVAELLLGLDGDGLPDVSEGPVRSARDRDFASSRK